VIDLVTRPALLASELLRGGARVVVVGSTARWLLGDGTAPRDLDVAVEDADVPALVAALEAIGVAASAVSLCRARQVHRETSWGPLDVFVGPVTACCPRGAAGTVGTVGFGSVSIPVWVSVWPNTQIVQTVVVDAGARPLPVAR
jgi:hypothetical protein